MTRRDATPPGWWVGSPSYHDERREWLLYAFDPAERPVSGHRKREWQAVAPTEEGVVREMARCLREISAGRVPKLVVPASLTRSTSGPRSRLLATRLHSAGAEPYMWFP